jgi:O-acetyl-ADP-ribose deacetylase (regulator of RNase III)
VELVLGDLSTQAVDAIVNAANSSLLGGGGVDGAVHRAAGPALLDACRNLLRERGPLPAGEAVLTPGFAAAARWIIHTVGPVWSGGGSGEEATLLRCYRSVVRIAREHAFRSIAIPSLSTGAFGYPIAKAAPVALGAVQDEATGCPDLELVRFVLWSPSDLDCYRRLLDAL